MNNSMTTNSPTTLIAKEDLVMSLGERSATLAKKGDRLTLVAEYPTYLEVRTAGGEIIYTSADKVVPAS
ncbi:hypothetical protein D3C87_1231370 [compost metagenome]